MAAGAARGRALTQPAWSAGASGALGAVELGALGEREAELLADPPEVTVDVTMDLRKSLRGIKRQIEQVRRQASALDDPATTTANN